MNRNKIVGEWLVEWKEKAERRASQAQQERSAAVQEAEYAEREIEALDVAIKYALEVVELQTRLAQYEKDGVGL